MKFLTTLAATALTAAALTAADPVPKFFNPEAEAAIRRIVRDELKSAALEAQPRAAQPAPASPLPPGYAAFYRVVAGGASGVLFVGRPVPTGFSEYRITLSVPSLDGVGPGVYQCDSVNGVAVMERRAEAGTAPVFSTPIRDAIYNLAAPSGCANGQCPTPRRR